MASSRQPQSCTDYYVAWICPLPDVELLPARLMLDEEYPTPPYDTHYDENSYICGAIDSHTIVLVTLPKGKTGNVNAGRLTGSMFKTFPNIKLAVLVGIGGGIPRLPPSKDPLDDIHLGDVVVGWVGDGKPACVYYDSGKSKPDGQFDLVGTMQDPNWRLLQALSRLASDQDLGRLTFAEQLERLQKQKRVAHKFTRPDPKLDRLFMATYHHIGDHGAECTACDPEQLVQRPQRSTDDAHEFVFHQGRIATGNAVIRDGEQREKIRARCDGALCVEMEAAGVDANRRCLVIRGISDYADSHKNDVWRYHAAGNAAAFARALLCRITPGVVKGMEATTTTKRTVEATTEAAWFVPFVRPRSFVGRDEQLAKLEEHISLEDCQKLAIYGLGGCGKTALALEAAYRTRNQHPTRAIFWVPAISKESFEEAYREIGVLLDIPGIAEKNADAIELVRRFLSNEGFGSWLLIVDNADDTSVLFDSLGKKGSRNRLIDCLPHSRRGSIVFTTRTEKAAADLADANVIELGELSEREAEGVLRTRLFSNRSQHLLEDSQVVHEFLDMLAFLALAIVQAAAFIRKNNCTLVDYMSLYRDSDEDAITLLGRDFEDQGRYRDTKNPIATTWFISFVEIQEQNELAAEYLSFMACTTGKSVPKSLLFPGSSRLVESEALGTLKAYAFITEQRQPPEARVRQHHEILFDMHRLVRLAMHNWLKKRQQWDVWVNKTLARLDEMIPYEGHERRAIWPAYLPHALHVVDLPEVLKAEGRVSLLVRIGNCEWSLGRYKAAEAAERKALDQAERLYGKEHPKKLIIMSNVAESLRLQGKYAEAEETHRKVVGLRIKMWGKEHRDTLSSMNSLALALSGLGKSDDAERLFREVLALGKQVLGEDDPIRLRNLVSLAVTLRMQGKYAEAEEIFREVVTLREKELGKDHPDTLESMSGLAIGLDIQNRHAEAEKIHRKVLGLRQKVLGKEHPETLGSMHNLAAAAFNQNKWADAGELFQKVLYLNEKVLGRQHPQTLLSVGWLARVLEKYGKNEDALSLWHRAWMGCQETLGAAHPYTQEWLKYYSRLERLCQAESSGLEEQSDPVSVVLEEQSRLEPLEERDAQSFSI